MKKYVLGRRTLIVLGGVGSIVAFILANGPSVVREWSQLLRPASQAETLPALISDGTPRVAGDFTGAVQTVSGPAPVTMPAAAPAPAAVAPPPEPAKVEVLKVNVPLVMSSVGEGRDQPSACAAAVTEVRSALTRRCERISLQNEGVRHDATAGDDALECSNCAYVGDRWRCAARFTTECKIYG